MGDLTTSTVALLFGTRIVIEHLSSRFKKSATPAFTLTNLFKLACWLCRCCSMPCRWPHLRLSPAIDLDQLELCISVAPERQRHQDFSCRRAAAVGVPVTNPRTEGPLPRAQDAHVRTTPYQHPCPAPTKYIGIVFTASVPFGGSSIFSRDVARSVVADGPIPSGHAEMRERR